MQAAITLKVNMTEKWERREAKLEKKKHGMRVSGRSIFTLQEMQRKRAEATKAEPAKATPTMRRKKKRR